MIRLLPRQPPPLRCVHRSHLLHGPTRGLISTTPLSVSAMREHDSPSIHSGRAGPATTPIRITPRSRGGGIGEPLLGCQGPPAGEATGVKRASGTGCRQPKMAHPTGGLKPLRGRLRSLAVSVQGVAPPLPSHIPSPTTQTPATKALVPQKSGDYLTTIP